MQRAVVLLHSPSQLLKQLLRLVQLLPSLLFEVVPLLLTGVLLLLLYFLLVELSAPVLGPDHPL